MHLFIRLSTLKSDHRPASLARTGGLKGRLGASFYTVDLHTAKLNSAAAFEEISIENNPGDHVIGTGVKPRSDPSTLCHG